jgi:hypothetical protein
VGQLEKGIGADRATTERLLLAIGARKSDLTEEMWTLTPIGQEKTQQVCYAQRSGPKEAISCADCAADDQRNAGAA